MNTTTAVASTWREIEDRRVLREYLTQQEMLDDIWEAHEHGWLPVSMTESPQAGERKFPPWRRSRKIVYCVTFFRNAES